MSFPARTLLRLLTLGVLLKITFAGTCTLPICPEGVSTSCMPNMAFASFVLQFCQLRVPPVFSTTILGFATNLFDFGEQSVLNFSPIVHLQSSFPISDSMSTSISGIALATSEGLSQLGLMIDTENADKLVPSTQAFCYTDGPLPLQNSTMEVLLDHDSRNQTLIVPAGGSFLYDLGQSLTACSVYMLVASRTASLTTPTHTFTFYDTLAVNFTREERNIPPLLQPPNSPCNNKCPLYSIPFFLFNTNPPYGQFSNNAALYALRFTGLKRFDKVDLMADAASDLIVFAMTAMREDDSILNGAEPTRPPTDEGGSSFRPSAAPTDLTPQELVTQPNGIGGPLPFETIPSEQPTSIPIASPTEVPTGAPSESVASPAFPPQEAIPTAAPTSVPASVPTSVPASIPASVPTFAPTSAPTGVSTAPPVAAPIGCPPPRPFVPAGSNLICNGTSWIITGSIVINSTTATQGAGSGIIFTVQSTTLNPTVVEGCVSVGADTNATIQIDSSTIASLIANKNLSYTLLQSQQGCLTGSFKSISVQCADAAQCESNCVNSTQQQTSRQLSVLFTAGCPLSGVDNGFIASSLWWIILVAVLGFVIIVALVIVILARTNTKVRQTLFPFMDRRNGPTNVDED